MGFIATQGIHVTGMESWVSNYSVEYSEDDEKWNWHRQIGEDVTKVLV